MSDKFEFREVDQEGMDTLSVIEEAKNFNRWMFKTIRPYCSGRILEIGSGIGNISEFFVEENADITLSDIRENYCHKLKKKFPRHEVIRMDLVAPDFKETWKSLKGSFDAVFALNVVEHIENDKLALENCKWLLKPGAKVVILVPAFQSLYNRFDKELEHYRRYTKATLTEVLRSAGFSIKRKFYFNAAGIPGWYVSGKLQNNKTIPAGQMKLYNALVPLFKLGDMLIFNSFGLSVVAVGENS